MYYLVLKKLTFFQSRSCCTRQRRSPSPTGVLQNGPTTRWTWPEWSSSATAWFLPCSKCVLFYIVILTHILSLLSRVCQIVMYLQHYSGGRDNLVLAPFGVATNVAMMLEGLQGRAADEITTLFRLQAKDVRQQLRRGFKIIFDTFGVSYARFYRYCGFK